MGNNSSKEKQLDKDQIENIYETYNIKLENEGKLISPNILKIVFSRGGCCGGTACVIGDRIPLHYVEQEPKVKIPYYGMKREQRINNQFRQFANGQFTLIMISDEGNGEIREDLNLAMQSKLQRIDEKFKPEDKLKSNVGWLHWLIVNIPHGKNISKGDICVDYKRPSPPKGNKPNRYVVFLYEQVANIPAVPIRKRQTFSISNFTKRHNLWLPIAVNYFYCQKWTTKSQMERINHSKMRKSKYQYHA